MDVIDRYFRTLRMFLPKDHRDDIVRELSEEVQSQVAAREAALGRPLLADERAAIVGQYGHPLLTASRYWPERHLIGPVVFPYYWIALKVALALVAIGHVLGAAVLLANGDAAPVGQVIENAIAAALKVAAWVTALGALADFYLARPRVLEPWNLEAASPPRRESPRSWSRPKRASESSVSRLVVSSVLGVWWLAGLQFPYLFFGPGAAGLAWGDAVDRLYPLMVIIQLTMLVEQFVQCARPESTRVLLVTQSLRFLGGAALIYLVVTSDHRWIVWPAGSATVVRFAGQDISLNDLVNHVWSFAFLAVAASSVFGFVKALWKRSRRAPATAHA